MGDQSSSSRSRHQERRRIARHHPQSSRQPNGFTRLAFEGSERGDLDRSSNNDCSFLKNHCMRNPTLIILTFLSALATLVAAEPKKAEAIHDLKIGDTAPDFSLPGIDGKTHTLAEYKNAKLLVIAFISNHCPDSHAAESRIKKLVSDMKGKSFMLVAINPNNSDGLNIDELGYSRYNDGFDDMKKYAREAGFNFPYLYDGEKQAAAQACGCLATPHVFLFNAARKLRYKVQFENSHL